MCMPELALDHDERHTLVGHLDRVRMAELMWRDPTPDPGCGGGPTPWQPRATEASRSAAISGRV
jgi:hypothetical protein